jgi:hypothetical protein
MDRGWDLSAPNWSASAASRTVDEKLVRTLAAQALATENRAAIIEALVVVVAHKELVASGWSMTSSFPPCGS